ncbi:hypothetical protein HK102_006712 [Quaeritorhiza haematococci]|nr:hypothetical protein HK102_006712 [Quaeritorhiza haematococci]
MQALAHRYHNQSRVVFPVWIQYHKGKKHFLGGCLKGFTQLTLDAVREKQFNYNGMGLLTGSRSGVIAVDIDNMEMWAHILETLDREEPKTCRARSQRGGLHLFFQDTPELAAIEREQLFGFKDLGIPDDFDILGGNKRFIVLPPSSFKTDSGERKYEYVEGFSLIDNPEHLLPAPRWLIKVLTPGTDDFRTVRDSFVAKKMPQEEFDLFGTSDEAGGDKNKGGDKVSLVPRKRKQIGTQQHAVDLFKHRGHPEIAKKLTAYFGGDVDDWTFAHDSDTSIKISRESQYCLVQRGYPHTNSGHSCIFINYSKGTDMYAKSVVLSCFSHGSVECTENLFAVFGWQIVQDSGTMKEPNMFTILSDEVWGYAGEHRLKRLNVADPLAKGMASREVVTEMNPVGNWFLHGEELSMGMCPRVYTEPAPDHYEYTSDVADAFRKYCESKDIRGIHNNFKNLLSGACELMGYTDIKAVNICKGCNKKALSGCCPEYSTDNRLRRDIIMGVRLCNGD